MGRDLEIPMGTGASIDVERIDIEARGQSAQLVLKRRDGTHCSEILELFRETPWEPTGQADAVGGRRSDDDGESRHWF